ncbi:hypothetical protein BDA99DRAFT_528640 [Phascolomyces articulosus]|uniref:F-box domain-containing protein n=1 Tax=Phascolomyces articulosus TaxID=60185 RepID=A0AAD5JLH1_9FUNG|nr:hypothetical protein BDA99DRAFT_528640 [Phascolomyces articulosus]
MMNDTNINDNTNNDYYLFDIFLPFDILVNIISHLDPHDCLTCMTVCSSWYTTIPHYAHNVWNKIQLSGTVKRQQKMFKDRRVKRLLGTHVKHVALKNFQEPSFYGIMQTLIDFKCTEIEHLGEERKRDQYGGGWMDIIQLK